MNLSDDTSRDSSVRVGRDDEENILFAGHNDVDLSVSSNEEFGHFWTLFVAKEETYEDGHCLPEI